MNPTDWVIGIVTLLTFGADFYVTELKSSPMTDMNTGTGNTRQHTKTVVFGF